MHFVGISIAGYGGVARNIRNSSDNKER